MDDPNIEPVDARYAAGFFDADGGVCAGFRQYSVDGKLNLGIKAMIANNDTATLAAIQRRYGGRVLRARGRTGCPPPRCWHLSLHGKAAQLFLLDVLPHLRVKKMQAELALTVLADTLPKGPGRGGHHPRLTAGERALRVWCGKTIQRLNQGKVVPEWMTQRLVNE